MDFLLSFAPSIANDNHLVSSFGYRNSKTITNLRKFRCFDSRNLICIMNWLTSNFCYEHILYIVTKIRHFELPLSIIAIVIDMAKFCWGESFDAKVSLVKWCLFVVVWDKKSRCFLKRYSLYSSDFFRYKNIYGRRIEWNLSQSCINIDAKNRSVTQ